MNTQMSPYRPEWNVAWASIGYDLGESLPREVIGVLRTAFNKGGATDVPHFFRMCSGINVFTADNVSTRIENCIKLLSALVPWIDNNAVSKFASYMRNGGICGTTWVNSHMFIENFCRSQSTLIGSLWKTNEGRTPCDVYEYFNQSPERQYQLLQILLTMNIHIPGIDMILVRESCRKEPHVEVPRPAVATTWTAAESALRQFFLVPNNLITLVPIWTREFGTPTVDVIGHINDNPRFRVGFIELMIQQFKIVPGVNLEAVLQSLKEEEMSFMKTTSPTWIDSAANLRKWLAFPENVVRILIKWEAETGQAITSDIVGYFDKRPEFQLKFVQMLKLEWNLIPGVNLEGLLLFLKCEEIRRDVICRSIGPPVVKQEAPVIKQEPAAAIKALPLRKKVNRWDAFKNELNHLIDQSTLKAMVELIGDEMMTPAEEQKIQSPLHLLVWMENHEFISETNLTNLCALLTSEEVGHPEIAAKCLAFTKQEKPANSGASECVVCLSDAKVMAPDCGHKCVCEACSKGLAICPICRAPAVWRKIFDV